MGIAQAMMSELEREAVATRRLLERVPAEKLTWRPHPKSMTIGQLAHHVASIPGRLSQMASSDGHDASTGRPEPKQPETADFVATLDEGIATARSFLGGLGDEEAAAPWRMTAGGREVFSIPRAGVIRTLLLNHWYHHRGQLVVYLRLLDVPVPATYGRSADENLFAAESATEAAV